MLRRTFLLTTLALFGFLIGSELAVFRAPTREHRFGEDVRSAVMSPDGKWVASVGMEEGGNWFSKCGVRTANARVSGWRFCLPPVAFNRCAGEKTVAKWLLARGLKFGSSLQARVISEYWRRQDKCAASNIAPRL